jgi:heme-binding protein
MLPARRAVIGALGAGAIAGALLVTAPAALAERQPDCTAADIASVASGVSAATSAYLFTHPDLNNFFTDLEGQPSDRIRDQVKTYMDGNALVKSDLTGIRQPLTDIKNRCGDPNGDGIADAPAQ